MLSSSGRDLASATQAGRLGADQPVEEQQRHGDDQDAARRAVEEAERAVERADARIDDQVGDLHGDDA